MANSEKYVLSVRSATSALRGQRILQSNGISATIKRNATYTGQKGCGYTLIISGDVIAAVNLLKAAEVEVFEIRR